MKTEENSCPFFSFPLQSHNVLIDSMYRAKLSDFGITYKRGIRGTHKWNAPEILRQEVECNTASDVYSFGMVVYEIYARKEPFQGEDIEKVLAEVCDPKTNRRPPVPATMPHIVAAVMHDCLVADPEERPHMGEITSRVGRFSAMDVAGSQRLHGQEDEDAHFQSLLEKFPRHIAKAIRDGRSIPQEKHECVTVLFCSIVDFDEIAAKVSQGKLFDLLSRLYGSFDKIATDMGVLKIESTGESWMAVTNCNVGEASQSQTHAKLMADFALKAIKVSTETLVDLDSLDHGYVKVKMGLHCGPVVSKVIGSSHNLRFALYGDTVNSAARILSHKDVRAEVVLCSDVASQVLQDQAPGCFETIPLGQGISGSSTTVARIHWVIYKGKRIDSTMERVRAKTRLRMMRRHETNAAPENVPVIPASTNHHTESKTVMSDVPPKENLLDNDDDGFVDLEHNLKNRLSKINHGEIM